jgi:hypothetical protein
MVFLQIKKGVVNVTDQLIRFPTLLFLSMLWSGMEYLCRNFTHVTGGWGVVCVTSCPLEGRSYLYSGNVWSF